MIEESATLDGSFPYRFFPMLRLLGAIRMAFDFRKLVLAAVGLVLLQLGWSSLDAVLPTAAAVTPDPIEPALTLIGRMDERPGVWEAIGAVSFRLGGPVRVLIMPLEALVDPSCQWRTVLNSLLGLVWLTIVWGISGGAIARIAVIQSAKARQGGIGESLKFARRSAGALILTSLCPLFGLAACALVGISFGMLYRPLMRGMMGPALAGVLLFIPLITGLVMTLLAAGLVAGWPLLHAALAAGADDALDAISRTFSYLNQRLGLFLMGLAMAWLAGTVGLIGVDWLADSAIRLTQWSLSLSGDRPTIAALFGPGGPDSGALALATHRFWLGAVHLLVQGWIFSFFWTAAAIVYLELRHAVDGTPRTEIDPPEVLRTAVASPTPESAEAVPSADVPSVDAE